MGNVMSRSDRAKIRSQKKGFDLYEEDISIS